MRSAKIKLSLDKQFKTQQHGWTNPVVPGDHPDPTIVQVRGVYWASSTSGEWSPQFPLFRSVDLISWTPVGAIFPQQPEWAEGSFWAPELVHDELTDRFMVWYVGKRRGGPLCIGVASAESAEGPYTDYGPLVCQEDGSIDPCFARDEHGEPYLIWKEDGNSQGRTTPIWAQRLSEDLLHLEGEKTMLIINDQPWEGGIVEGAYILRHAGRFYMFYAGNSCCGKECQYAEGVARADRLLGPWEKYPGNPLIGANDHWRCPGHGTALHSDAVEGGETHDYLLYHAYPEDGTIYVGREAVLDEVDWLSQDAAGRTGWPSVSAGAGPGEYAEPVAIDFVDNFEDAYLGYSWQWPVNTLPEVTVGAGVLWLGIPPHGTVSDRPVESAMIAVPRPAGECYQATVGLEVPAVPEPRLWVGLTLVGDPFNTIGLGLRGKEDGNGQRLVLWERRGANQAVIWEGDAPEVAVIWLRSAKLAEEHMVQFYFSHDGERWEAAGGPYDASELPAWDRALRLGLLLEGPEGSCAAFQRFRLRTKAKEARWAEGA